MSRLLATGKRYQKRLAHLRRLVQRRDRGVCAVCGWDCELLEEVLGHAQEHFRSLLPREGRYADARAQWLRATVLMDLGLPPGRGTLWDADHVVPLVLGGGDTLENLRTLCIPCHAAVTAPTQTMAAKAARLQRKMPRRPPVAYSRG